MTQSVEIYRNAQQHTDTSLQSRLEMSSCTYDNVIVFGPTGTVGGLVALEASKRGAKVCLAMRDPSKPIQVIPFDVESSGKFSRIQADLSDPASVAEAVKQSGAKAAYVYCAFIPDHLRGSFQAMREAGIEYVVFLSSYSIKPEVDIRQVSKEAFIAFSHAQVEIAAEDVGFPYFTALRPGQFATNHIKNFLDTTVTPPRARFLYDDAWADNIVPEDIGTVGGAVLVERPSEAKEVIYLLGPEMLTAGEAWATIRRVTGRNDINATPSPPQEWAESLAKKGIPPPVINYLSLASERARDREATASEALRRVAASNIKKYTGREPTKFAEYIEWHKADWAAL